jgi:hypothetical protein
VEIEWDFTFNEKEFLAVDENDGGLRHCRECGWNGPATNAATGADPIYGPYPACPDCGAFAEEGPGTAYGPVLFFEGRCARCGSPTELGTLTGDLEDRMILCEDCLEVDGLNARIFDWLKSCSYCHPDGNACDLCPVAGRVKELDHRVGRIRRPDLYEYNEEGIPF